MFKIYKEMFKNLRDMQDQLWKESTKSFPDLAYPRHLNTWQLQTLEEMSTWAERAVSQSLELQQKWLEQWSGRADSKKLKPKFFQGKVTGHFSCLGISVGTTGTSSGTSSIRGPGGAG